jgi:hypothetical protein
VKTRVSFLLVPVSLAVGFGVASWSAIGAQQPTDVSVQSSPTKVVAKGPVDDAAVQSSPVTGAAAKSAGHLRPGTAIPLKLSAALDSGSLKNGQTVSATLTSMVPVLGGATLAAGTPVQLTVVETLAAGKIASAGEISLQVQRVGTVSVYTDTQTFRGQPGHKDVADSAPQKGTDARLAAGAMLKFHVQPQPQPVNGPPANKAAGPGDVNGVANGAVAPKQQ